MKNRLCALITGMLLMSSAVAFAQQHPPQLKTIPDSINYIWKDIEQDFAALAEVMPEDKWSFKPTQGEFKDVRTFGEQVKHVACANEAWAKQMVGEKPPARCAIGRNSGRASSQNRRRLASVALDSQNRIARFERPELGGTDHAQH
jgi:hypothetical protein